MWSLLAIFFLQFSDKLGSSCVCLSPLALELRAERGIGIDSLDYAVSPLYLDSLRSLGARVIHTSRWLNGASVEASSDVLRRIDSCSFVSSISLTRADGVYSQCSKDASLVLSGIDVLGSNGQINQLHLSALHELGYMGEGIRIGVADGGFYNADKLSFLPMDQCLGYADFTDDVDDFFGVTGTHGTLCLSAIVGKVVCDSSLFSSLCYVGTAPLAEYYLFRTEEHRSESPKEIDNWVSAIEMADSLGLHIVSTSLGYTRFDDSSYDYVYSDMDGVSSRGALASLIASRKGLLLVTAMGNDGDKAWHYLSTPADADSILSVGAVDISGNIASFSSFGPSWDGRVKPEVCALGKGTVLLNPVDGSMLSGNGTSFACPLIAGMAACLWSALPGASNMEIRDRIVRSSDRYADPDAHYGYGIPNAWLAYTLSPSSYLEPIYGASSAEKIVKDGHIYIVNEGQKYDLLGNKIR